MTGSTCETKALQSRSDRLQQAILQLLARPDIELFMHLIQNLVLRDSGSARLFQCLSVTGVTLFTTPFIVPKAFSTPWNFSLG